MRLSFKSPLKGTGLKGETPFKEGGFGPSFAIPATLFLVYLIQRFLGSKLSCGIP
jgi:hypothetical protein